MLLLGAQVNPEAAIQMERLGNQLIKVYDVNILGGYLPSYVPGGMDGDIFQRICAEHSARALLLRRSRPETKVAFSVLRKPAQLGFWNKEFCKTAIKAHRNPWK